MTLYFAGLSTGSVGTLNCRRWVKIILFFAYHHFNDLRFSTHVLAATLFL